MKRCFSLLLLAFMLSNLSYAQTTYVELILDASGSMWNKLNDGNYRIVAAKDVLSSFVSSLPADNNLNVGLRVYGSQTDALTEGACEDSQLFVPMNGIDRNTLLTTVRNTDARGATPIAYSLQLAAQDFPADGKKIIILVTDGEESCGGDVRGTLESLKAQGIDVDLKIIGFDLNDAAIKSFEGLGSFENATNAAELAGALGRAVEVQEALYPVTVQVTRSGAPATDGVRVVFVNAVTGDDTVLQPAEPGSVSAELAAGSYLAQVEDAFSDGVQTFSGLNVVVDAENVFHFELAQEVAVDLSVTPEAPVTGSHVDVAYSGAPEGRNWITIVPADAPDALYLDYEYVTSASGSVSLRIPGEAGPLEARYHLELPEGGTRIIGRSAVVTSVQATATLQVPAEVNAGTEFEVSWTGPDNDRDYVTVVPIDAEDGSYQQYNYTREGSPMSFTASIEPGVYEVRYQSDITSGVIARQAFTVVASDITLTVPAEVPAGEPFEVSWTGPDGERDYLTVVPADAPDGSYKEYSYTREGNTLKFNAPIEPGTYELRYQSDREGGVFARQTFTVIPTTITLNAPDSIVAGTEFTVNWTGPDGQRDYITIVPADAPEGTYKSYKYTREGPSLNLIAPIEAGAYEIRYQSDRESGVFARIPVTVTPYTVTLDAPAEVTAGETFTVTWTGPDGPQDYITIVPVGADGNAYTSYAYTRNGASVSITAPDEPGAYEVRYQSDRERGIIFGSRPITVK